MNSIKSFLDKNSDIFYYSVIFFGLTCVLFSNPFLIYPYDAIYHLMEISNISNTFIPKLKLVGIFVGDLYIMIPNGYHDTVGIPIEGREIWHYVWAKLFDIIGIIDTEVFLRAKIIHVIQVYISLFSIYYFSKVVIRNVFNTLNGITLKWLSAWSVIIWITIFATFSLYYQQVWLMWYSVNYQITLPLFWYMIALTLVLFLEEITIKKKIFFVLQILILSRFILQTHSMEFMYYLMYLSIFVFIFIDKVYLLLKRYYYLFFFLIGGIYYFIIHYQFEQSNIFKYISMDKLPLLYQKIMHEGQILINGLNRVSASINELMYFILYLEIVFVSYLVWHKYKHIRYDINIRVLVFIMVTSMFILIPLYQFSGGLFSVITKTDVVNRLYYSSSLFVLLPIFTYYIFQKSKLRYINLFIALSLIFIIIFSKYNDVLNHNYYKNINSIRNSFNAKKVGFNLTQKQIDTIGNLIHEYEQKSNMYQKVKFYARADIAFVIKYIYKKNVYWEGRRANPNYKKIYKKHIGNKDYYPIFFQVPENFPRYRPYQ